MLLITSISELRKELKKYRKRERSIGFVPTMGYLHEGHLSIVRKSCKENIITVVSIFVNPTQFGPSEDLDVYPRDIQRDETMLMAENVDILFYPAVNEMYPEGFSTSVSVGGVTENLCGSARPGHFDGVALVVTKLLNIVQPTKAYFGLKDYQQFLTINRLTKDLNIFTQIVGHPIVREGDGLAMSSRNVFLSHEKRESALSLYRSFDIIADKLRSGETNANVVRSAVIDFIKSFPYTEIDYAELVDPLTLKPVDDLKGPFMCMLAVFINSTRLIDNKLFNEVDTELQSKNN